FFSGLFLTALSAVVTGVNSAFTYKPEEFFYPFFNFRTLTLTSIAGLIFFQLRWMNKRVTFDRFTTPLVNGLRVIMMSVIFILVTTETNDFFYYQSLHANKEWADFYNSNLPYALSFEWVLLSFLPVWFGLRQKKQVYFFS